MINLQNRKKEIMEQIGIDGLAKLKKVKLLKLLEFEIQQLLEFWTLGQILQMINDEFKLNISKTVFYDFCKKNFKNVEKIEIKKTVKKKEAITTQKDIKEKQETSTSILDEDELNVIAMFSNPKKD